MKGPLATGTVVRILGCRHCEACDAARLKGALGVVHEAGEGDDLGWRLLRVPGYVGCVEGFVNVESLMLEEITDPGIAALYGIDMKEDASP